MPRILVASNNAHKVAEITEYLQSVRNLEVFSLSQWQQKHQIPREIPDPDETGVTYLENALIKARAVLRWASSESVPEAFSVLSDDSGIEVEALDNQPGIYSARFALLAGDQGTQTTKNLVVANNLLLLQKLEDMKNRKAKFIAQLVLIRENGEYSQYLGELTGEILAASDYRSGQSAKGFGYDPIFKPTGCSDSLAKIKSESPGFATHRILALNKLRHSLESAA